MTTNGSASLAAPRRAPDAVLIIDDHELFRTALVMALGEQGLAAHQMTPAGGVDAILAKALALPVGVVLLDLHLGQGIDGGLIDGVDLIRPLRIRGWRVLVVSGSRDEAREAAAIAAGAVGSVPKSAAFVELLDTVRRVAVGETVMEEHTRRIWLARHRTHQTRERELAHRLGRLSTREREVLELLAHGYRAATIAERFVVSLTTVRTQIRAVLAKLEVGSQLEAVALTRRRRW